VKASVDVFQTAQVWRLSPRASGVSEEAKSCLGGYLVCEEDSADCLGACLPNLVLDRKQVKFYVQGLGPITEFRCHTASLRRNREPLMLESTLLFIIKICRGGFNVNSPAICNNLIWLFFKL
jgi:hypothetical protein